MRRLLAAFALGLALVAPSFVTPASAQSPPTAPLRVITIVAPLERLKLEVADTFDTREYGLMNRTLVPAGTGMIFVFKSDGAETFWMKNTLVSLDMVFVHGDGKIESIAANVPASTLQTPDDKVATRLGNGRFVIELGAGDAARAGLKPGTKLVIPALTARE